MNRLTRWIAAALWGLVLLSPAQGQTPTSPPGAAAQGENSAGPLPWGAALVFTIVIMLIVCMPSRKS
jgi:hypothetical protein